MNTNHNRTTPIHHQSTPLHELSAAVLNILRSPPSPYDLLPDNLPPSRRRAPPPPITPAGFASLMLGISVALMLCGSITFLIGFMLVPWVLGLFMVLYFVGLISTLSFLGRSIVCYATSTPALNSPSPSSSSLRRDISGFR